MTKPSYEELERYKEAAKHVDAIQARTIRELRAENLRVRGLLQRQWVSVEERLPSEGHDVSITVLSSGESYVWAGYYIPAHVGMPGEWFYSNHQNVKGSVTHWQPFPEPPTFPQSSELVSQGAESADIGKLDTAPYSGQLGDKRPIEKCADCDTPIEQDRAENVWRHTLTGTEECPVRRCDCGHGTDVHDVGEEECQICSCTYFVAGSAETGGEKAALDLESKTPAGLPLTVGVEGDQLVIRIGVDTLAFCFEIGESNQPFDEKANDFRREWKVTDRHKFAKGVCHGLMNEREDGSTPLSDLIDKAYTEAIESDMGVDEDGRIVTNEMLHPSPSFRRSPQNQPARRGVEGAHEGTTAHKSESREPEKLLASQRDAARVWMNANGYPNADDNLCDLLANYHRAAAALAGWTRVEDRPPKLWEEVLISHGYHKARAVDVAFYCEDKNWQLQRTDSQDNPIIVAAELVSHWQPVPEPASQK